jgi:acetyl/propionyl-CoA carboxylase alpha subunit
MVNPGDALVVIREGWQCMKLFIANRGEIAARIIRTARQMGVETVLGVSEPDAGQAHP